MYEKSLVDGSLIFEDKVIQNIVGIAVSSSYGVVEMASVKRVRDYVIRTMHKKNFEQGVVIKSYNNGIIDLDIHIVIGYRLPIRSICDEVKKRVAYELEKNLNIKVRNMMVYVEAIDRIE